MRALALLLLAAAAAGPAEPVDVLEYRITVLLQPGVLEVKTTIRVAGDLPGEWTLELAPEMKVKPDSVTAAMGDGTRRPVPISVVDRGIVLDLSGARGALFISIDCAGAPSERFSKERGGFVRSAVGPDLVYIRSQVPWYPRVPDDPAIHHVGIFGREGWERRSAGEPQADGPPGSGFSTAGPIDRAGLAAGPWKVVKDGAYDALVFAGHEKGAAALLPLARKAVEYHAGDLGPLPRKGYSLVEMPKEFGTGSGYSECGYILLGPGAFEAGPNSDWVPGFLAHEAAHQWWGLDGLFSDFASEALAEYSTFRFVRATNGAEEADRMRRRAAERVAKAKPVALSSIRGWGGNMDPETYRAHAYEKSMLLLCAVEEAAGQDAMKDLLRKFLAAARRKRVGWTDLREALAAAGPGAKAAVELWEKPGMPKDGVPAAPPGEADAKARLEAGMRVATSPAEADPRILGKAIEDLRAARKSPDLSDGEKAAAQTGIGRCLFRLGKLEEAERELREALAAGGGGPFHRGWIELHLGNIDDLRGKRKEALAHYQAVVDNGGASKTTVAKAKAFLEKPYRGFAKDG